jgi:ABC-type phosphate transport system auxiliary subunit
MGFKQGQKWLLKGGLGAVLVGSGFSLGVEASHWKHSGVALWQWMGGGTLGIAILIIGLIVLIKAGQQERS